MLLQNVVKSDPGVLYTQAITTCLLLHSFKSTVTLSRTSFIVDLLAIIEQSKDSDVKNNTSTLFIISFNVIS